MFSRKITHRIVTLMQPNTHHPKHHPLFSQHHPTQTHLVGCSGGAAVLGQFQHGPVALAAGGTVKAVRPIVVDPLVVTEVAGQTEGLPAQVAHVALLTVDSHMVAQGHVVGVGLAAKVAPEFWQTKTV